MIVYTFSTFHLDKLFIDRTVVALTPLIFIELFSRIWQTFSLVVLFLAQLENAFPRMRDHRGGRAWSIERAVNNVDACVHGRQTINHNGPAWREIELSRILIALVIIHVDGVLLKWKGGRGWETARVARSLFSSTYPCRWKGACLLTLCFYLIEKRLKNWMILKNPRWKRRKKGRMRKESIRRSFKSSSFARVKKIMKSSERQDRTKATL